MFELADVDIAPTAVGPDDTIVVRVEVVNTGDRTGSEVVQCYARAPRSAVERPPRWLVGFEKVHLSPGDRADVEIEVPASALAHYDESVHDFVVEATDYELLIGRHSLDPEAQRVRIGVS